MHVCDEKALGQVAWKVVRGWITFEDVSAMREVESSYRAQRSVIPAEMTVAQMQPIVIDLVGKKMSGEDVYGPNYPTRQKIAKVGGLTLRQLYDLYVAIMADVMVEGMKGQDSDTFEHPVYTDAELKGLAFKFVVGIVDQTINPGFRSTMTAKMTSAIALARGNGVDRNGILEMIIKSNDEAMDLSDFRRSSPNLFRIFKYGGIADESEIFSLFKIFLAYRFYDLGS